MSVSCWVEQLTLTPRQYPRSSLRVICDGRILGCPVDAGTNQLSVVPDMANTSLTGKDEIATAHYRGKFIDFLRSGAYVNLNDIAMVHSKRLDNWMRLQNTKELLEAFKEDRSYNGEQPFKIVKGNFSSKSDTSDLRYHPKSLPQQGTWAHPDIAIEFARWCNPRFGLWCNRQIRHLLTHGEVNLHSSEWSIDKHEDALNANREDIKEMYGR